MRDTVCVSQYLHETETYTHTHTHTHTHTPAAHSVGRRSGWSRRRTTSSSSTRGRRASGPPSQLRPGRPRLPALRRRPELRHQRVRAGRRRRGGGISSSSSACSGSSRRAEPAGAAAEEEEEEEKAPPLPPACWTASSSTCWGRTGRRRPRTTTGPRPMSSSARGCGSCPPPRGRWAPCRPRRRCAAAGLLHFVFSGGGRAH